MRPALIIVRGSFHFLQLIRNQFMTSLTLFLTVLLTVFIAEMGDKTQLMLIALTSKYKLASIVTGTAAAILVLNGLAVIAGGLLNEFLSSNLWIIKGIACLAFFYFSVTSLIKEDEEEECSSCRFNFAPLAVFCTFFVAELGDKTQLTAITFGATNGLNINAFVIWISASIGLFAADIIGLLIGLFLHGKTPDSFFNLLAFAIFAVFGFVNLPSAMYLFFNKGSGSQASFAVMMGETPYIIPVMITVLVLFIALCSFILLKQKKAR